MIVLLQPVILEREGEKVAEKERERKREALSPLVLWWLSLSPLLYW